MNRRDAIKRTGLLLGTAVSASVITGVMQGCQPSYSLDWQPLFLTEDQAILVGEIAETILPETETLGAKSLHLDEFIDLMLQEAFRPEEQDAFVSGLADLATQCQETQGKAFLDLTPDERLDFLREEERSLRAGNSPNTANPTLLR